MDKRSIFAIILVTIIILLLPKYYDLIYDKPIIDNKKTSRENNIYDESLKKEAEKQNDQNIKTDSATVLSTKENMFAPDTLDLIEQSEEKVEINIETPLVSAKISNMGGGKIIYWYLKNYNTWLNEPAKIIDAAVNNGPDIKFLTLNGEKIDLNNISFFTDNDDDKEIKLNSGESIDLQYYVTINDINIQKILTFHADFYHVDVKFSIDNPKKLLLNNEYQMGWNNGLISNEENMVEDYSYSEAYSSMGEEIEDFSLSSEGKAESKTYIGNTEWIAIRTKYFLSAIVPKSVNTVGVTFEGEGVKTNDVLHRKYDAYINISEDALKGSDGYFVYMGPLDYSILSDYEIGLDDLVLRHGWYEKTFRAISLPIVAFLKFIHIIIPNYGIVIILFSILVKIIVYPLTKKSYKSMKEMSRVQPLLVELREKYKSDPQRLNKETMKLYKEHGINPLGGCLPMLLQLPLLAALFIVFRSTIQLRGATFIPGWISDLSAPDTLFTLPFSLPLYGDQFNLLPILMAGSMIFQSKMTMQDPKQKAMVYLMPIFMLLIFNKFPSGLNLYYTLFNVLTIIQQKFTDNKTAEIKAKK